FSPPVVSCLSTRFQCHCYEMFLYKEDDENRSLSIAGYLQQGPVLTKSFVVQAYHTILYCRFPNHKNPMPQSERCHSYKNRTLQYSKERHRPVLKLAMRRYHNMQCYDQLALPNYLHNHDYPVRAIAHGSLSNCPGKY